MIQLDKRMGTTVQQAPITLDGESPIPQCLYIVHFKHDWYRQEVSLLEYEAYEEHVEPRLEAIVAEMRNQWPDLSRVVLAHRTGALTVGESSVVVAAPVADPVASKVGDHKGHQDNVQAARVELPPRTRLWNAIWTRQ